MDLDKPLTLEAWATEIFRRFPKIWDEVILPAVVDKVHKTRTECYLFYAIFGETAPYNSCSYDDALSVIKLLNKYLYLNGATDLIITTKNYYSAKAFNNHSALNQKSTTGVDEIDNSSYLTYADNCLMHAETWCGQKGLAKKYFLKITGHESRGKIYFILHPEKALDHINPTRRNISNAKKLKALQNIIEDAQGFASDHGLKVILNRSKGELVSVTFRL